MLIDIGNQAPNTGMTGFYPPNVYRVAKNKDTKEYYLEFEFHNFKLAPKHYGKIMHSFPKRIINDYRSDDASTGAMFLGKKGTGKSELASIICNMAIEYRMIVVKVTEIIADLELIFFLNNLSNVVLLFDEFGKVFNLELQDKMLSMFSTMNGFKKLSLITDNGEHKISDLIRNRPGRIPYRIDFDRMKKEDVEEVCADYKIKSEFSRELFKTYNRSKNFSIDQLQKILKQHVKYPEDSLEYLLEIMNVKELIPKVSLSVTKVIDTVTDKEMDFDDATVDKKVFDRGRFLGVTISDFPSEKDLKEMDSRAINYKYQKMHQNVSIQDLQSIKDDEYVCMAKKRYLIYLNEID